MKAEAQKVGILNIGAMNTNNALTVHWDLTACLLVSYGALNGQGST